MKRKFPLSCTLTFSLGKSNHGHLFLRYIIYNTLQHYLEHFKSLKKIKMLQVLSFFKFSFFLHTVWRLTCKGSINYVLATRFLRLTANVHTEAHAKMCKSKIQFLLSQMLNSKTLSWGKTHFINLVIYKISLILQKLNEIIFILQQN